MGFIFLAFLAKLIVTFSVFVLFAFLKAPKVILGAFFK